MLADFGPKGRDISVFLIVVELYSFTQGLRFPSKVEKLLLWAPTFDLVQFRAESPQSKKKTVFEV